jgi:predicted aminopeptidase
LHFIANMLRFFLAIIAFLSLSGCTTLSYYTQMIQGHLELMSQRRAITSILQESNTTPILQDRLTLVLKLRRFASDALALPDNTSYLSYADIHRPYVVWNVVATPPYSLTPLQWCFPLIGCVSYRGFYHEYKALQLTKQLAELGYDVIDNGVPAYSTLGWFSDPVLNTMLHWDNIQLAKLIFHELAHQKLYIKNDSNFNEAFATKVAQIGIKMWLDVYGSDLQRADLLRRDRYEEEFITLVFKTRTRLETLYASKQPISVLEKEKTKLFKELKEQYGFLQANSHGLKSYSNWFSTRLNNAKIASLATYYKNIPAFEALFTASNRKLTRFYTIVEKVGALPPLTREQCLRTLTMYGSTFLNTCFGSQHLNLN